MNSYLTTSGQPQPLGVSLVDSQTINIAVLAPSAQTVFFCIFNNGVEVARLPLPAYTDGVLHGQISGLDFPLHYGLRASGEFSPERGLFFDESKLLVDPYATQLSGSFVYDDALCCQNFGVDTTALVPKVVFASNTFTPLSVTARPPQVIYEASVRALTMLHPEVPEHLRGTVAALREPCIIAHLHTIGVDTLELMPITAWVNERHLHHLDLHNAWGYNPIAMMALEPKLCPGGMVELRDTVAALRAQGIQVILDVVFNHTGESDVGGPMLSMRGLDNRYYYQHDGDQLVNVTGCGNTLACGASGVAQLVLDSLRYWVQIAGVAGFRFDLAPVLGRLAHGFDAQAPLLRMMREDPVLSQVLLIAEPWDIGMGGYQLGQFGAPWLEWNDKYRDDVRRFWHGVGAVGDLATRLAGSSDVFHHRQPAASVNFIAAHDGFCLHDLVSYEQKHNWANGEQNRDGSNDNVSWNNGAEGMTDDEQIQNNRLRDVRALLATLFVSQGTVMLSAGDEWGRSQGGNNNAYAQDNATTWLDWSQANGDLIEFVGQLAKLRRECPLLRQEAFLNDQTVTWHRADGQVMDAHDWHNNAQVLGMQLKSDAQKLLLWFNASQNDVSLHMPAGDWQAVLASAPAQVERRSVAIYSINESGV